MRRVTVLRERGGGATARTMRQRTRLDPEGSQGVHGRPIERKYRKNAREGDMGKRTKIPGFVGSGKQKKWGTLN